MYKKFSQELNIVSLCQIALSQHNFKSFLDLRSQKIVLILVVTLKIIWASQLWQMLKRSRLQGQALCEPLSFIKSFIVWTASLWSPSVAMHWVVKSGDKESLDKMHPMWWSCGQIRNITFKKQTNQPIEFFKNIISNKILEQGVARL